MRLATSALVLECCSSSLTSVQSGWPSSQLCTRAPPRGYTLG
uniref:Uncharacterized protein n=1 Tax=Arundo donax TaxID=35708 RepID=A0A0A9FRQ1_ARUDO